MHIWLLLILNTFYLSWANGYGWRVWSLSDYISSNEFELVMTPVCEHNISTHRECLITCTNKSFVDLIRFAHHINTTPNIDRIHILDKTKTTHCTYVVCVCMEFVPIINIWVYITLDANRFRLGAHAHIRKIGQFGIAEFP